MKVKTSELQGTALDWTVAKCEGYAPTLNPKQGDWSQTGWWQLGPNAWRPLQGYSTDWSQGGPIIEREKYALWNNGVWWHCAEGNFDDCYGTTPLLAAMRCFVTSKLGEEVDIPDELAA